MRQKPKTNENTYAYLNKVSNSSNVSPARNFFSQPVISLSKAVLSMEQSAGNGTIQNSNSHSRSPFQKHQYLVPQPKIRQQSYIKSKSYIQSNDSSTVTKKTTTNGNSQPTQSAQGDDIPQSEFNRITNNSNVQLGLLKNKASSSQTHKRAPSKVFVDSSQTQNRPSSTNGQNKRTNNTLIQKIKEHNQTKRPIHQQSQLLRYHQELTDKQYQKLQQLEQHYLTYKKSNQQSDKLKIIQQKSQQNSNHCAITNEDFSNKLVQYIKNQSINKKIKGYRSISNPDIGTQLAKKLTQITSTAVLSQPGVMHTGQVKNNQDSYLLKENLLGMPNCWLMQVSDGHGTNGHFVAQFVREKLPNLVEMQFKSKRIQNSEFSSDETDSLVNTSMRIAFERTSRDLYSSGIDITFSGATTVTVVIMENEVWCANIGDSRAIIARALDRSTLQVVELSNDHKPDTKAEEKRIINHGGRIQPYSDQDGSPIGPARVWLKEENIPGLAMSRSFGDYVASQVGVISIPEIIKHTIRPQDKFLVIASDGIWEFLTNDWIVNTVYEYYLKNDVNGACIRLVEEATLAWEREDEVIDDITCIIAFIGQNLSNDCQE